MSLDQIALRGLRVYGYHGVLDSERRDGQEFGVNAVLWLDTAAAAASDDLTLTVDYAALADRLAAIVAGPPVRLIETLAQRLADAALDAPAGPRGRDHRAQAARARRPRVRGRHGDDPPRPAMSGAATPIPRGHGPAGRSSPSAATWGTGWPRCRAGSAPCSARPA